MTESTRIAAGQAEAEQFRPGRRAHLEKIITAVRAVEYAADDPTRSAGPAANGIIWRSEVGLQR